MHACDRAQRRRRCLAASEAGSAERLGDDDVSLDAPGTDSGRETALGQILARLPRAQRSAVEMVKLEGPSVAEAARRAGIAPGTMRVRVHRGYRALRELLPGKQ